MKAASSLLSAAAAVAFSLCLAVSGSVALQLASVSAAHAAVVSRIEVRGNQRVDAETIRNYVGIRPGVNFSNSEIDEAVKRLFATGLFSDVRINQVGGSLVVVVDEHAIINQVLFQGNKKIKDAQLRNTVQLQPRGSYSASAAEADVQAIRAAYSRIGRDDANVSVATQQLDGSRVNVVFQINEGGRTKIRSINFVGNSAFGDGRLADVISTKRSSFLSFLTRNDIYDDARLRADEEALRRFYYNRGYADFQVVSSHAELDETSNEYTITFTVDEGEKYVFGDIAVDSTISEIDPQSLVPLLETRTGRTYSAKDVEDSLIALTERLAGQGYAFAQVTPRGSRDFASRTISVLYAIDQGPRAYVERIEIRGNVRTRDYVIRREFDIAEGDAFNQVLIQRAKRRLEALDYFEAVNIATAPGSEPDQVVLVVDLVEKSTGELSIGAGYQTGGQTPGFIFEGGIGERNFLGRGQSIRVSVSGGKSSRDYMISFTEPYFLGRRIAAGFDIYRQTRNYTNYNSQVTGGTVRFGLPITNNLSTQLAYNYAVENYSYTTGPGGTAAVCPGPVPGCPVAPAIQAAIPPLGPSGWTKSSVSASLVYNSIDDTRNPHQGLYATFTTEFAGIGGDANFLKLTGRASYYHTLSEELDLVGLVSAGGGHVIQTGGTTLRVFDLFQSNDRIIRGFAYNGIGPAYTAGVSPAQQLGGTTYFNASAEVQFPLPVVPHSFGLKGALFADAATLYGIPAGLGADPTTVGMNWRASVGASLMWNSPFGPLRVDYAVPVMSQPSDRIQNFNFGISTRF
jgi:outer membrane protein insertion porin family